MVLFAKVVLSTLALLPFFCFYRKTFRTTLELERYTAFNEVNNETDEVAFNFELATSKGDFKSSRTYRLPKVKLAEVAEIENRIQTLLSGNDELDVCILLKMLNEKLR